MAQELVIIHLLHDEEKSLDGNWTLMGISFNLFLWSILMHWYHPCHSGYGLPGNEFDRDSGGIRAS